MLKKYVKNEKINGFSVTCESGFYIAKNDNVVIVFDIKGGNGLYFNINWIFDKKNIRTYKSPRYHYKYLPIIRDISYELAKMGCVWDYKNNRVYVA